MYVLVRSRRSRHIRLSVSAGGRVLVSAPSRISDSVIQDFLLSKQNWLCHAVERLKKIPERTFLSLAREEKLYKEHKSRAVAVAAAKVKHWNSRYNFSFGQISIRNSRSRWGSCTSKGTLCFNYKIAFLPEHLADYLVVHELCHLKERNHSKDFWALVAREIPEYLIRRKELGRFEPAFPPVT